MKSYYRFLHPPKNMDRFAMFNFEGQCIAIMNGHFDYENPELVVHRGEYSEYFDDLRAIASAPNTRKFVLNFWDEAENKYMMYGWEAPESKLKEL